MSQENKPKKIENEALFTEIDEYEEERRLTESLREQVGELETPEAEESGVKKKKSHKGLKIAGIVLLVIVLAGAFLVGTKPGRSILLDLASRYIDDNVTRPSAEDDPPLLLVEDDGIGDEQVDMNIPSIAVKEETHVTNYLLVGIETIFGARNTDAILIASVNTDQKVIKLTSLLRDTLVELPGYSKNKLNTAYAKGGADYLVETIETNFRIKIDGYATVNFEAFESIVDQLGGIEIELTQKEADYLNTTNYISKPEYRTVRAGVQTLNGNQALGYCRVRKVATLGGANYDYGRTVRQRRVLNAIFEKYKSQNILTLLQAMTNCLSYVTTDVSQEQIKSELTNIVENGIMTMEMLRIPEDGYFTDVKEIGTVKDVLVPDMEANIKLLHEFIY